MLWDLVETTTIFPFPIDFFVCLFLLFHSFHLLFVISFPVKPCRFDNQAFGINQSIITSNCQERCGCDFHIGVTITTLKHLCKIEEHPKCDPYSEVIEEHQTPLNDTSFLYTQKKCMAGLILILV